MSKAPPPDAGSKRAAEVSEAMLGMPGYADDSMFFIVRYAERCKVRAANRPRPCSTLTIYP